MKKAVLIILAGLTLLAFLMPGSAFTQAKAKKILALNASGSIIDPDRQTFIEIKHLIEKDADVNHRDAEGVTPLMRAAFLGNLPLVNLLVDSGAGINARDNNQMTPLMNAAGSGYIEIAKHLISSGADVNARDVAGVTALMIAALNSNDDVGMVKLLVESGADVNLCDANGNNALAVAENRGNRESAKFLSELTSNESPTTKNLLYALMTLIVFLLAKVYFKRLLKRPAPKMLAAEERVSALTTSEAEPESVPETPMVNLMEAVIASDVETLKRGLNEGGDVDTTDKSGWTLLMNAASKGMNDIVAVLVEGKANLNYQDKDGRTALMNAVYSGKIDTMRLLIGSGADVNLRGADGRSAYIIASDKGNAKIINLLKAAGAVDARKEKKEEPAVRMPEMNLSAGPKIDETLRSFVSEENFEQTVKMLEKKADPNVSDKNGVTVLMIAASAGNIEIMKALIKAGAEVNAKNSRGVTPLMFAAGKGHAKAAALLIKAGSDLNAKTSTGITALKYANEKGFPEVAAMLKKVGALE
ncbi:MAG TPA: ankyrin repeat domain-containing protein [Candidatus Wallbacteria bacterium]|nr:ankyrin repeat domain-containing protein [Candidatus Wallbacteria bacterium]